ncbi:MAG: LpqB family beta-propeller domain-containing protein [Kitasatospora sp.]|nr:LpqB family beta-propeller domain-containing protein [Kitasatospora sp.]
MPERPWPAAHAQIIQRRKTRRRDRAVRLRHWLTPLAAAAAVAVAVTVPLALFHGHKPTAVAPSATASGPGGAPPFYMFSPFDGRYAAVASTATGKTLVTIKPPRGTNSIGPLGAAADPRTFLLSGGTSRRGVIALFLLHFHPQTRTASLTPVPGHVKIPFNTVPGFALSPDGTRLALIDFGTTGKHPVLTITVVTLATGSQRTRTVKVPSLNPQAIGATWSADGRTVQVVWTQGRAGHVLAERLDIATPGNRLPRPAALPIPSRQTRSLQSIYVTPDGDIFLAVEPNRTTWTLTEFSPRTGRLTPVMGPVRRTKISPYIDWASNAGHALIISGRDGGLGVLHNSRYLPLPLTRIVRNPLTSTVW